MKRLNVVIAAIAILVAVLGFTRWKKSQEVKREKAKIAAMKAKNKKTLAELAAKKAKVDKANAERDRHLKRQKKQLKEVRKAISNVDQLLKVQAELAKLKKLPNFKEKVESLLLQADRLVKRSLALSLKGKRLRSEGKKELSRGPSDYLNVLKKYKGDKSSPAFKKEFHQLSLRGRKASSKVKEGQRLCTEAKKSIKKAQALIKKAKAMIADRLKKQSMSM